MTDAGLCHANWYVIYPVALLPRLERDSLDYSEPERFIRDHCCRETEDCSPRRCYLLEGPLPAAHIASCEVPSRI